MAMLTLIGFFQGESWSRGVDRDSRLSEGGLEVLRKVAGTTSNWGEKGHGEVYQILFRLGVSLACCLKLYQRAWWIYIALAGGGWKAMTTFPHRSPSTTPRPSSSSPSP